MVRFEAIADEYDAARPSYPQRVYEALGPLAGRLVLDVGAGTGIATMMEVDLSFDPFAVLGDIGNAQ